MAWSVMEFPDDEVDAVVMHNDFRKGLGRMVPIAGGAMNMQVIFGVLAIREARYRRQLCPYMILF